MDSCVCAALAARDYDAAALHVSYGQRTEDREGRRAFSAICDRMGIQKKGWWCEIGAGRNWRLALTDPNIGVPESPALAHDISGQGVPVTYVPFRNAHFLSAAVSWAEVLGAGKIYIGAVEQDSLGYADCRPAYYQAFNQVIKAGTKEGQIEIVTPLIQMRKFEIIRLGLELGAPLV